MTKVPTVIQRPSVRQIYNTTHTTKVTGYHRRLALPCLGKAYCSRLLHITALLVQGSLLSLGFENTAYFRIVIIPYVEQEEVPRYYGKKETRK